MSKCKHCGEVCDGSDFCCSGCEAAHSAVKSAGLPGQFSMLAVESDDGYQLEVGVEGIHCASCIRLIENALADQPDVIAARVNMTTERLSLAWSGARKRGDELASIVTKLGYKLHAMRDEDDGGAAETEKALLVAIAVAGFAAGNLMLISVGLWSSTVESMGFATREFFHWISALIALPVVVFSGQTFFRSAFSALKSRHTNMDVPISLAVILASVMSVSETIRHGEHVYFDSAVMLLFFLLIGRYLDARAKGKARESASKLLSRLAGFATIKEGDSLKRVPISQLKSGMVALVTAGENIPADGVLVKGESEADLSLITGETIPEHLTVGKNVFAGTVNLSAPIEIEITKATEKSLLSEIVRMMEVAEQGAAKYVRVADKAAALYTPVVHLFGLLTFLGWWLIVGSGWQDSLLHAVTVLIITCPCALGLAVPVVQVLASGTLMKSGILLKSGDALERLSAVDTVVFDKTGTLTVGHPELQAGDYSAYHMQLAASLASQSSHPLSKALAGVYEGPLAALMVEELPGKGLVAYHGGREIRLGSRRWCGPTDADKVDAVLELWLSVDGAPVARFTFADTVRKDAADVIGKLQRRGLECHLLSGDRQAVAESVGQSLGFEYISAEVTPAEKCTYLEELKASGKQVLMVGDGLNDAPALASAHASMSPSSAIDITQNTADIVFQGDKLQPVLDTFIIAKRSTMLVRQNFMLAIAYNIVAVPLAILGFVTPMIAAAAMSGSSLVVILNAFRLTLKRRM